MTFHGLRRAALAIVPPSEAQLEKGARFVARMEEMREIKQAEAAGAPVAPPVAERLAPIDPTQILSPSSLNTFLDCEARWFYRKVLGLPETRGAAAGLGSAVHAAIAANYRQKIDSRRDLHTEGVLAVFRDAWKQELDTCTLDKSDDVADLANTGEVITRVYMEQCAPRVQPAAVEMHVEGLIGNVPVQGYIDVLDVDGQVIDTKTAKRKPSGISPGYRAQVSTYAMLAPQASGRARLDTFVKSKTVQHVSQSIQVAESDRKYATKLYAIAREKMQTGLVSPNRGSNLCSRKYCSHWQKCVEDYGGEVKA
jgi:CRISPR/Cas system-associated exonuclease Cas4 (RecB family)